MRDYDEQHFDEYVEDLYSKIFSELYDRKGFDDWWEQIEEDTQWEISEAIQDIIKEHLAKFN
jgi:hypothetical protein